MGKRKNRKITHLDVSLHRNEDGSKLADLPRLELENPKHLDELQGLIDASRLIPAEREAALLPRIETVEWPEHPEIDIPKGWGKTCPSTTTNAPIILCADQPDPVIPPIFGEVHHAGLIARLWTAYFGTQVTFYPDDVRSMLALADVAEAS